MRACKTILLTMFWVSIVSAQNFVSDSLSKVEMKKLDFLIGEWVGSGWMYGQDRVKYEFDQTENIIYKLDSTVILIEGIGKSNGKLVHHALAMISYNKADKNYDFQSFLANGLKGSYKAEIKDGQLYWYPTSNTQYIIWLDKSGRWVEKGEYKAGDQWFQFLEMTLTKTN